MHSKQSRPGSEAYLMQQSGQALTNGLHADASPFVPGSSHTNGGSQDKGWDAYQDSTVQQVPPGMDRDAFVAGERAAMARSLQMMLPSQQAIGMLSGGLQRLEGRLQEESMHHRQTALATADAGAVAQALHERLDNLERIRLPAMDSRIQHAIEAPLSQEFRATLQGLQGAINNVQSQSYSPYSITGFVLRQLGWLGATASEYTQTAISKADVAAIFLSRKILLDTRVLGIKQSAEGDEDSSTQPRGSKVSIAKAICGATLFLAAIEASWQLHSKVLGAMPDRFRRAILPAQLGLRVARIATWAATLTLSAVYFRRICYLIADSSISSVERAIRIIYGKLPFCGTLAPASKTSASSPAKSETEDLENSPKGSLGLQDSYNKGHDVEGLAGGGHYPITKQRSVFDTPPPSPPPKEFV